MSLDLKQMTPEEQKSLVLQVKKIEQDRKRKRTEDVKAYKSLTDDLVFQSVAELRRLESHLLAVKHKIYERFDVLFELKKTIYPTSDKNNKHTFTTTDGKFRLHLGYNMIDHYDDTVDAGVGQVKNYIESLGENEKSRKLIDMVLSLLSKDSMGNLKASRIMSLYKLAQESGNACFIEGVKMIQDAYHPQRSKTFIRIQVRDEKGEYRYIPLSLTDV